MIINRIQKYIKTILLSSITSIASVTANAQTIDGFPTGSTIVDVDEYQSTLESRIKEGLWSNLNTGPDGNLFGNDSALTFQIYDKSEKVTLNFGLAESVDSASDVGGTHQVYSYNLNVSAPSNKDNSSVPLPTLDSLQNAYSVGFSFSYSRIPAHRAAFVALARDPARWAIQKSAIAQFITAPANASATCNREINNMLARGSIFDFAELDSTLAASTSDWRLVPSISNKTYVQAMIDLKGLYERERGALQSLRTLTANQQIRLNEINLELNGNPAIQDAAINDILNDLTLVVSPDSELIRHCLPQEFDNVLGGLVDNTWTDGAWSHTFTFKGDIGNEEFDYLDPMSFENQEVTKRVESITAAWTGHAAGNFGASNLTASYTYQRGFVSPDESTMCLNEAANPEEDCRTGVFGSPVKKDKSIISIEGSTRFDNVIGNNPIAIKLKASRDIENDVTGIDIPVYLFSFAGEDLDSGIRLGWQSQTEETNIGFFYQQKF